MDQKHKCIICGKEFKGYGNNAEPIKKGICCDECNIKVVIPLRFSNSQQRQQTNNKKWYNWYGASARGMPNKDIY